MAGPVHLEDEPGRALDQVLLLLETEARGQSHLGQ